MIEQLLLHQKYRDYTYRELIMFRKVALDRYKNDPSDLENKEELGVIALYVQTYCKRCFKRLNMCMKCGELACKECREHQH